MTVDGADPGAQPVVIGARRDAVAAMTRTQSLIWASQRLHPDVPLANMGNRFRLSGAVDPVRLVRAFESVVRHCEVLRMVVLPSSPGSGGQRTRSAPVAVEVAVLTQPPGTTEVIELEPDELDRWSAERIGTPIDATVCVFDSVLIRHAESDWTWWLDIHHVATDAWSSALIFEATAAAYEHDSDPEFDLADLIDGRFFSANSPVAALDSLGVGDRPDNGTSRSLPIAPYGQRGQRTTAVERCPLVLNAERRDAIETAVAGVYRTLSREMSLLGLAAVATALTLHRLDGRSSTMVGVPVHHRSARSAARLVGPLMELYPLEVEVDPTETHRAMFKRVVRSIMMLLHDAAPGESPDSSFEVVLNVITAGYGDFGDYPSHREWMRSGHVDPNHVVRSQIFERPATGDTAGEQSAIFNWELDLNVGLSVDGSARQLPRHFASVLDSVVTEPDALVVAAPVVDDDERHELARLSPQGTPRAIDVPVHDQIRVAMRSSPGWIVAEHAGVKVTAAEFDRRADELARWLQGAGLEVGRAVGLRMERSTEMLIAVHGVLRAGGVFVMLSPDDPPSRHETVVVDADLLMILDALPEIQESGSGDNDVAAHSSMRTLPQVQVDDLAYILYTSGSTGEPKGVPISHRGLADYLEFAVEAYIAPDERFHDDAPCVALHSSLVFDLTITSLFISMLVGGRVVIFDQDPIDALAAIANDDRISFLKATPSQLELLIRMSSSSRPLRVVVVGGEAFRRPVATQLAAVCEPGIRIFNEYGPTEAVVGCMIHQWDADLDRGADVPIGHAAAGSVVAVLDQHGHLTPTGAWGELYVQRPGMAHEYLNRPELSAERFVSSSLLDSIAPGIWYRTGDRVRVERTGIAVYGGRIDDQMKVNGIRLEPAEVEAAIVSHPGVTNALVRMWHRTDAIVVDATEVRCRRCGLGTDVPGIRLDSDDVCNTCRDFDAVAPQTEVWFRDETDLDAELERARHRRRGEIDCLHLLSGGKDSTYALYQLVARGWNVHALTLDNGFISEGAKENVRRSIADLGITHEFATTDAMNEIFRDSLDRYSNVCQGCYKTIYTIAVARAHELGIPVIVTGLSRGQFFETRLVPHQFEQGRFDPADIDRTVLEARRVYHHTADAVTELLPEQRVFDDDAIFDEVEFVDFYRYVDVDLAELYEFLEARAPWVRPADTGRSTNCLINVAGIHTHRLERGFHNYAEPYSWDVRLGHKTRDEALEELDDEVDLLEIERLLGEVGYEPKTQGVLTAWYQSTDGLDIDPDVLRAYLRDRLADHAVPAAFVRVDDVPMAASAKADPSLLPAPTRFHRRAAERIEPGSDIERQICSIWADLLALEGVGVTDDFFDLGGASLSALEVVAALDAAFGTDLPDAAVFRARTVRELAVMVGLALSAGEGDDDGGRSIPQLDPAHPTPLSAGEESMLFEYRTDPTNTRYNVARLYTIDGAVDIDRFEQAVRAVVMVHGPLHTSYGSTRRRFSVDETLVFREIAASDPAQFAAAASVERTVPFDLDHGPLVRVHHARTGADQTSVLFCLHHISLGVGTFDLLWDQVISVYGGAPIPRLEVSYAEHTAWQRGRASEESAAFWLERSRERRAAPELGTETPPVGTPDGYVFRRHELSPSTLVVAGHTPFAAATAALACTLSRFSGSEHVEFGIAASTKDHIAATPIVGYYLNALPVEISVDIGARFDEVLDQASSQIADAISHRTYPFASMVRDARDAGLVTPNVSFMLAYDEMATPEFPGARVTQQILASGSAVTDVTFFVQERIDSIQFGVEYRGTVIDEATALRLLSAFEHTLLGGAANPSAPADAIEGEAGTELEGEFLAPTDDTVLARIIGHASSRPDALAVVDAAGGELTYRQMVSRVLAVAELLGSGVQGQRVGVALERSVDVVVAILAIQCAGAAYVPLDPGVGRGRLDRVAAGAELDYLVTARTLMSDTDLGQTDAGLGATFGVPGNRVTFVDDVHLDTELLGTGDGDELARLSQLVERVELGSTAYVIFTSGSTGRPRGVAVSHANLAASTFARDVWYEEPPDRFLLTSSIGFDSSIVGLFWPLTTGGTIVIPDDDIVHDVDRIGLLIERSQVTHVLMVPSLYRALLDRAAVHLGNLQVVIVAGEECPAPLVRLHEQHVGHAALVNEYGPTEATVWVTAHRLDSREASVSIGAPIPGSTLRVVDPLLRMVPVGVAGELIVAGPGVTGGYLDDPSATSEKFVAIDGRRWYRTGDLARVVGPVASFIGRLDDQLNVGGNRLEPIEVEAVLRDWPDVRDAVVVVAGNPQMLVAHVEQQSFGVEALDDVALRHHLAGQLPAPAIPRRIITHPSLPRNVHGKIDRRAASTLPVTDQSRLSAPPAAPDALVEGPAPDGDSLAVLVLAAWRSALGRHDIGLSTDFFDIGGDSLAAVEIVTRVGEVLERSVPIAALLAGQTPQGMADRLADRDDDRATSASDQRVDDFHLVTMRRGSPLGPLVLMTPAWDDLFGYQALADELPSHVTVLALVYVEHPERKVITTVDDLVDGFINSAVAATRGHSSVTVLGWSVGGVVAVELAERIVDAGEQVDSIALVDTLFPGEEQHLWSNRWWKYKSLLRPGSIGQATSEARIMGGRRIKRVVATIAKQLLAWAGTPVPDEPERTSVGGFPVEALGHRLGRVQLPVVFYGATDTNPDRTINRWVEIVGEFELVQVKGRHRGYASIMSLPGVATIAADLAGRLPEDGASPTANVSG